MKKHSGFILAESLVSLFITLLIAVTLTFCLGAQYKQIKIWEDRINAHKLILINLDSNQQISEQIVKGQKYLFDKDENTLKVRASNEIFKIEW